MKKYSLLSGLLLAVIIVSCGTNYTVIRNNIYDSSELTTGKIFSFIESEGRLPDGLLESDYIAICDAIAHQLTLRGLKREGKADLLIKIGFSEDIRKPAKSINPESAPFWIGPDAIVYRSYFDDIPYTHFPMKKYILMDIIDTKTDQVVYDAAINSNEDGNKFLKRIRTRSEISALVEGLFEDFPIKIQDY